MILVGHIRQRTVHENLVYFHLTFNLQRELPGLQVLVIAPTREIAMQGLEVASQIGANMPGLKISSFIGGLPLSEDKIKAVSCQMAIGTPGRLKQLFTEVIRYIASSNPHPH